MRLISLKIVVCAKQVPDVNELKIDKEKGTIVDKNIKNILNCDDLNALEESLKIKDIYNDTQITVVTMGPPEAKDMLLECLALGADEAILITDKALEGSDSLITSEVLAAAISKIGNFDLIFTGRQATGGDTAQVGPQLAEKLNIPQVTGIINLSIEIDMKTIVVKRALENRYETIKLKMPCLLTAVKELNKPRSMSLRGILDAGKKNIKVMTVKDIEMPINMVGQYASPTKIAGTFVPVHNKKCKFIYGKTDEEAAEILLTELKGKYIV